MVRAKTKPTANVYPPIYIQNVACCWCLNNIRQRRIGECTYVCIELSTIQWEARTCCLTGPTEKGHFDQILADNIVKRILEFTRNGRKKNPD
jgi:hypothetical protein